MIWGEVPERGGRVSKPGHSKALAGGIAAGGLNRIGKRGAAGAVLDPAGRIGGEPGGGVNVGERRTASDRRSADATAGAGRCGGDASGIAASPVGACRTSEPFDLRKEGRSLVEPILSLVG